MSKKKIATVVKIWKDEPRAGTKIIADGFNREHEYVLRLVQKHESHFLEFEINTPFLERSIPRQRVNTNKRGQPVNEYLLNEDQALFAEMYGKTEIISKQLTQQKVLNM